MVRTGFGARGVSRPPYIPRKSRSGEEVGVYRYVGKTENFVPAVVLSEPGDGVTRCLEEIATGVESLDNVPWTVMVSDLTKRSEWGLLDFLVKIRNDLVSSIDVADPRYLPDYYFRGFGYLAILYWCIEYNCEGDEPKFEDSPYLAHYRKVKNPIKVLLSAGVSEFLELGGIFFDLVTSAIEESIEERVTKNLKKLARSKLPIGNGPASKIRKRLSRGEDVGAEDIRDALIGEFDQAFGKLSSSNSERCFLSLTDAADVIASGCCTRAGREFGESYLRLLTIVNEPAHVASIAGGREAGFVGLTRLTESGWAVYELEDVSLGDLKQQMVAHSDSKLMENVDRFASAKPDSSRVNLAEFAEFWATHRGGREDELV